eukprot:7211566-Prymnesium_polylepis.2
MSSDVNTQESRIPMVFPPGGPRCPRHTQLGTQDTRSSPYTSHITPRSSSCFLGSGAPYSTPVRSVPCCHRSLDPTVVKPAERETLFESQDQPMALMAADRPRCLEEARPTK